MLSLVNWHVLKREYQLMTKTTISEIGHTNFECLMGINNDGNKYIIHLIWILSICLLGRYGALLLLTISVAIASTAKNGDEKGVAELFDEHNTVSTIITRHGSIIN